MLRQWDRNPSPPPKSIVKIRLEELSGTESELSLVQDFEYTPSDIDSREEAWNHMFSELAALLS